MLGGMGDKGMAAMAKQILKSEGGKAMFSIITGAERGLVASVKEQHDALGIDEIGALPDSEDRAEELYQLALAKVNGRFPAFAVENQYGSRLDNAEEAAEFAALDVDEWEEQKAEWADRYRSQGVEGTDEELAEAHVRARYDVDMATFETLVVDWSDDREARELERIVTAGLKTAQNGIDRTTAVLEAADVEVEGDVVVSDP